jgi:hypothetical protein
MAGLSFMESFALGSIAGSLTSQTHAGATQGFFEHMRHKRDLAQADADYAALVDQYNVLVDRFNHVYKCAKEWEVEGARRSERIKQLKQEFGASTERAETAERLLAETAAREADFRSQAEFYKDQNRKINTIGTAASLELRKAKAEIARLKGEPVQSDDGSGESSWPDDGIF